MNMNILRILFQSVNCKQVKCILHVVLMKINRTAQNFNFLFTQTRHYGKQFPESKQCSKLNSVLYLSLGNTVYI